MAKLEDIAKSLNVDLTNIHPSPAHQETSAPSMQKMLGRKWRPYYGDDYEQKIKESENGNEEKIKSEINREEAEKKAEIKKQQKSNKETTKEKNNIKPLTLGDRSGDSGDTLGDRSGGTLGDSGDTLGDSGDTLGDRSGDTLGDRSGDTLGDGLGDSDFVHIISKLDGYMRKIFSFIVQKCIVNSSLETGAIATRDLAKTVGCTYDSAKTFIKRLIKRNLIIRRKGYSSALGFVNLGLTRHIKNIATQSMNDILGGTLGDRSGDTLGDRSGDKISRSSSYIKTTTTTTINTPLENGWENINYRALEEAINFSESHLRKIIKHGNLTPEEVQNSIYHFAHDLQYNNKISKIRGDANAYFLSILREGVYLASSNFEYPEIIRKREYLANLRKQDEEKEKLEKEIEALEFSNWRKTLSEEDAKHIVASQNITYHKGNPFSESALRNHFTKHREEILK